MLKATLLFIGIFVSNVSFAQAETFSWEDEVCAYKGQFDTKKVSTDQLKQPARLIHSGAPLFSISASEAENDNKLTSFVDWVQNDAHFVVHPAIVLLRQKQQEQAQFWYDLTRMEQGVVQSQDYAALVQFRPERTQACVPIVQALSNSSEQATLAHSIFSKECNDNGNPKQCVTSQMAKLPLSLLNYSWHNCANRTQPEISDKQLNQALKALRAQLTSIKQTCDEP